MSGNKTNSKRRSYWKCHPQLTVLFSLLCLIVVALGFSIEGQAGVVSYADQCEKYPAFWITTVKNSAGMYTQPCIPSTNPDSKLVATLKAGTRFTIDGLFRHPDVGNYWYHGKAADGKTGYIYYEYLNVPVSNGVYGEDYSVFVISSLPTEFSKGGIENDYEVGILIDKMPLREVRLEQSTFGRKTYDFYNAALVSEEKWVFQDKFVFTKDFLNGLAEGNHSFDLSIFYVSYKVKDGKLTNSVGMHTEPLSFSVKKATASTIKISPTKTTYTGTKGKTLSIGGKITSNYNITSITATLEGHSPREYVSNYNPNSKSVDIGNQKKLNSFKAATLSVGTHKLVITAKDTSGATATETINIVIKEASAPVDDPLTPITSTPATVGSGYTTSGAAVKTLQNALNKVNNAGLTVDGKYGTNTKKAITNYQKKKGLTADGICGPKTWAKLIEDYNALIYYTVSFDSNGGNDDAPADQKKQYGKNLTLSSTRPTQEGYSFQGWATSSDGAVAYQPGGTYSNNAAVTLYAVWKANTYTVSYNANGGSGAPGSQTKTHGQNMTLSGIKPIRTGHDFLGWSTSDSGSVVYQAGGDYSNNADVTLYAVWSPNVFIVYFDANGGASDGSCIRQYGSELGWFETPSRTGYVFVGWFTDADGGDQVNSSTIVTVSVTYYAHWNPETYIVSYNANGGSSGVPENKTKTYGQDLTLSSAKPARDGYTFQGWATSSDGAVAYQPGSTYSNNETVTLYAVWQPITYIVSYDANGGSGAPAAQTKTYGKNLALSNTKPTRSGYTFQGWAASKDGKVAYQPEASYSENKAVTLYAVWKVNTYTVTFDANGGSGAPAAQTKTYGKNLTLSSTKPTRTGYTFQGWSTSKDGKVEYKPGATYSKNAKVTLYAVWKQDAPKYLPGDINGDGKVNIFDVIRLLKKVTGENVETFANTDVNADGKVNIFDVIRLLKYVTGEKVEIQ